MTPRGDTPASGLPGILRDAGRGLLVLVVTLAVWWGAVRLFRIPPYLLPTPDTVAARLVFLAREASLATHVAATLTELAWGFLAGAVAGIALGWIFVQVPVVGRLLSPLVLLLQTAPKIALAPLLLLWLGLGLGPKVTLIAIVTLFPVLAGTVAGLGAVEPAYRDLARLLRLAPWQRFARVDLPFALPAVFAGLRIATTQAVTAAVVGELIGATAGLGYLLSLGQENNDAATTIAAIVLLAAIGWAMHEAVRAIESRVLAWR